MNRISQKLMEPVLEAAQRLVAGERRDVLLECVEMLRCEMHKGSEDPNSDVASRRVQKSSINGDTNQKVVEPRLLPISPETIIVTASQLMASECIEGDAAASVIDASGSQFGQYQIKEMIGEGGMGIVYRAEQREPIQRTVAIKMARQAIRSVELLQRFELERQSLAKMDHEGIARLLEAGQTPEGLPFFVMEFVQGQPVTDYCRQRQTSLADRLKIFLTICDAIQHAHQRGILHRDIKPGNVLASEQPATLEVRVKVIDFGLAKVLGEENQYSHHQTLAGQILGTLSYMSPEQAIGNPAQIDLRSDVYALGALLFEMLTDTPTIDVACWKGLALPAVLRQVQETPAPFMSRRLSSLSEESIAELNCTKPEIDARIRVLSGDLDLIVAKAIDKDVRQRYQSVSEFAEDLRRYLQQLPVMARKPSFAYTSLRFVQRNKIPVAFTGVLVLASILAMGSWALWTRKTNADLRANLAESRIQKESVARMLADSRAELAAEKSLSAEAALRASERDRLILQLVGTNDAVGSPQKRVDAIDQAMNSNVMDDSGRCDLQLAKLEILYAMQRFSAARTLAKELSPVTPQQAAMAQFWNVRMRPALAEERTSARELLAGESANSLAASERLFLTALTCESRAEAIPVLEQLLQHSPKHVTGRKFLQACLLFEGRHEEVIGQASILRILQPDDPETEIAVALALVMLNSSSNLEQQIERLRSLLSDKDISRIELVLKELSRTSSVISQWDSGGLSLPDLLKTVAGLSSVLDSFSEDTSVLDSGLNALATGLYLRSSDAPKASTLNLGLQFGGRFLMATAASALGNYKPVRDLADDLAMISPFQDDAFFHFLRALAWIAEENYEDAILELELAEKAPCVYRSVKPEIQYCLAMSWAAINNKDKDPESLERAVTAADRWAAFSKDYHGGRVGNLLPIWKRARKFEQALAVLDNAERTYPAASLVWNELRLHVFLAAGRFTEVVELSDRLAGDPEVDPQKRETFLALRRDAASQLKRFFEEKSDLPGAAGTNAP